MDTLTRNSATRERPPMHSDAVLAELRAIRREQADLRALFDQFAGAFLNAKFPFGKPTDRWARR